MSYQKYTTEAVILRRSDYGEADRMFVLYTKAFGLVQARGSAVRRETSKMRYALQSCDRAHVSLVRGNRGWRVAGSSMIARIAPEEPALSAFARVSALVERLVAGEETSGYLFDTLADAHAAFIDSPKEDQPAIELVCVARVLYALGYISPEALGSALFAHTAYGRAELEEAAAQRAALLSSVNAAMTETHL